MRKSVSCVTMLLVLSLAGAGYGQTWQTYASYDFDSTYEVQVGPDQWNLYTPDDGPYNQDLWLNMTRTDVDIVAPGCGGVGACLNVPAPSGGYCGFSDAHLWNSEEYGDPIRFEADLKFDKADNASVARTVFMLYDCIRFHYDAAGTSLVVDLTKFDVDGTTRISGGSVTAAVVDNPNAWQHVEFSVYDGMLTLITDVETVSAPGDYEILTGRTTGEYWYLGTTKGKTGWTYVGQMDNVDISYVPEPVSMVLLGLGGLLLRRRRR